MRVISSGMFTIQYKVACNTNQLLTNESLVVLSTEISIVPALSLSTWGKCGWGLPQLALHRRQEIGRQSSKSMYQ